MGGGLMQLVAYGAQDVYLTGNPLITFFKVIYRRHTNFAVESIEQTFNGSTSFAGSEKKVTATISRNGDLITNMWLEIDLPVLDATQQWCSNVGHAMIKSVELEIGGQRIDKWDSCIIDAWQELTCTAEKAAGYATMTESGPGFAAGVASKTGDDEFKAKKLYIPLQFFFCRNVGLALPLIALQYHEVKINIEFRSYAQVMGMTNSGSKPVPTDDPSPKLYVDYVYLDTDERRRFAQVSHEMLIEQVQFTGEETLTTNANQVKLNFNHPVKELIMLKLPSTDVPSKDVTLGSTPGTDIHINRYFDYEEINFMKLMLNGHERFSERKGPYFNLVQPYQHHTRVPEKKVYVYSFALKPEEHQPSGTCNFSRIDNAVLSITVAAAGRIKVYALSYNVLRIMSGMGGLAFSN